MVHYTWYTLKIDKSVSLPNELRCLSSHVVWYSIHCSETVTILDGAAVARCPSQVVNINIMLENRAAPRSLFYTSKAVVEIWTEMTASLDLSNNPGEMQSYV